MGNQIFHDNDAGDEEEYAEMDDHDPLQGLLKDAQISHLEKENELLRQQKESLMAALR